MANPVSRGFLGETIALAGAVVRAMRITALNLFRKPVTVHYPEKPRAYPDRYRGLLALTYDPKTGEENCIGCRLCEFICPPAVIKVEMLKSKPRNFAKSFSLELYACEFCELCVQVCPTDAIVMMKSFDLATTDRREMLLDKDRLHAIGLQHKASWATGNLLRDSQEPPKPPAKPAEAAAPAEAARPAEAAGPAEAAKPAEAATSAASPTEPATAAAPPAAEPAGSPAPKPGGVA